MAQTGQSVIQLYHSTTGAAVPLAGDLAAGELAINTNDEKLYFKNSSGTVKELANSAVTANALLKDGSVPMTGPLAFEGSTADAFETSLTVVDPTADQTITLPNATGTVPLLESDQTWTGSQRGTITTDNDGSFDQSVSNNFFCTPTGAVALTFTNHTAGQSGLVLFVNTTNYAITAAATTYIAAADLTKLSATGTYLIAYLDNGTNAYCTVTAALTSAGA